jgi:hypothetical protein
VLASIAQSALNAGGKMESRITDKINYHDLLLQMRRFQELLEIWYKVKAYEATLSKIAFMQIAIRASRKKRKGVRK